MTAAVRLDHYDAERARPRFDELVALYLDAHDEGGPFYTEDRYRRQLAGHMSVPGWHLVTAAVGDELAGYIYGFPLPPNTRWWEGLVTALPDDFVRETGRRTFGLSELLVRPAWRRQHVAKLLHDELLGSRREERAMLLARPDNTPAQTAYAKWGWHKAAQLRPAWEHAPLFDVLIVSLPPVEPAA